MPTIRKNIFMNNSLYGNELFFLFSFMLYFYKICYGFVYV